jgi:glycosyltransferase involved in cell wall biosynthesis
MAQNEPSQITTNRLKTVVVVDPFSSGHHPLYFVEIVRSFLDQGKSVYALCPSSVHIVENLTGHPRIEKLHWVPFEDNWRDLDPPPTLPKNKIELLRWRTILVTLLKHRISPFSAGIFLPWLDNYLYCHRARIVAKLFPYRWCGIYFQPPFSDRLEGSSRYRPVIRMLRSQRCRHIYTLCHDRVNVLQEITDTPVSYFPDFINSEIRRPELERSIFLDWGKAKKNTLRILLVGSIGKRKGLLTLLKCAKLLNKDARFEFLIAGSLQKNDYFSSEEQEFVDACFKDSKNMNILTHLERIATESEINHLISTADLLFGLYEDFDHSSNMLGKSAFFKTPLIASSDTYMGRMTECYELGWTIPGRDPQGFRTFLLKALEEKMAAGQVKLDFPRSTDDKRARFLEINSKDRISGLLESTFQ